MERLEDLEPGADDQALGVHPLVFVAVLAGVVALAYASTTLFFDRVGATVFDGGPPLADVPDVTGHDRVDAIAELDAAGFMVTEQAVPNTTVATGLVTSQSPTAGNRAEHGSEVIIVVSAGAGFVPVPDVSGSPLDELQLLFFTHGLGLGEVVERESDLSEGEVIEQHPSPGQSVAAGTTVDVVVSSGPPMIAIPDISDLEALDAARLLRAAGFDVVYEDRYSWRVRRGYAIDTEPEEEAPRGSLVVLKVSRGPAPTTTTTTPPTPEPTGPSTRPDGIETYEPASP